MSRRSLILLLCATLSACGVATTSSTSSQSVATADEQKLEGAIDAEARHNTASYFQRRLQFTIYTRCNPTSPDLNYWSCVTTVASPRPGTEPCQITTEVRSQGNNFEWHSPVPFSRLATDEQCGTLHSELPIN